jgi:hypothetical protein
MLSIIFVIITVFFKELARNTIAAPSRCGTLDNAASAIAKAMADEGNCVYFDAAPTELIAILSR